MQYTLMSKILNQRYVIIYITNAKKCKRTELINSVPSTFMLILHYRKNPADAQKFTFINNRLRIWHFTVAPPGSGQS